MERDLADYPHHDGSPLYVSNQNPRLGDTVSVRVRVPRGFGEMTVVRTRSNPDREPSYSDAVIVHETDDAVWWEAAIHVENPVHGYRFLMESVDGATHWLTSAGLSHTETRDIDDFRLVSYYAPPAWGAEAVMYQVFPDRFARSAAADDRTPPAWAVPAKWSDPVVFRGPETGTQFYGGDLQGVIDHLDHLVAAEHQRRQRAAGHELLQRRVESLVHVVGVVLVGEAAVHRPQLQRLDRQTLTLEAGDDLAEQAAAHGVGLDEHEGTLDGAGHDILQNWLCGNTRDVQPIGTGFTASGNAWTAALSLGPGRAIT